MFAIYYRAVLYKNKSTVCARTEIGKRGFNPRETRNADSVERLVLDFGECRERNVAGAARAAQHGARRWRERVLL